MAVGKLKAGESVLNGDGEFVRIDQPVEVLGYFEVFHVTLDSGPHNYVANGLLCHNGPAKAPEG